MDIVNVKVGPIQTNCYIVCDKGEALVIDPGAEPERILVELDKLDDIAVKHIVLTHGHWDHICAVPALIEATDADLLCHAEDIPMLFDEKIGSQLSHDVQESFAVGRAAHIEPATVDNGDLVTVGDTVFTVIHTPGHTKGCICLYCPAEGVLFAGDTLFAGGRYGRTDFPGGSREAMIKTLSTKFVDVDDNAIVFSGHEANSTMLRERELNEYLR